MSQLLGLAEVNALGYKRECINICDVSNAFGLIFQSITSPRASVTENLFLLNTKQPASWWKSSERLTRVMVGLLGGM